MQEYLILIEDVDFDRYLFQKDLSEVSHIPFEELNGIFGTGTKPFKWDTSMEDMKEISKIYNTRVITLQYIGNKISECYREYYLCGRVQIVPVRMGFDPFNEDFLN